LKIYLDKILDDEVFKKNYLKIKLKSGVYNFS